jgi:hypothetical protein
LIGFGEKLSVRGNHIDLHAFQRNPVARADDRSPVSAHAHVGIEPALVLGFDGVPVIKAFLDRDHLRECPQPSDVVRVKMGDDQVVDPLQSRLLHGRDDPFGVSIADFPSGVDEQRFAAGRYDQRRAATFGVDPVDIQVPRLRLQHLSRNEQESDDRDGPSDGLPHDQLLVSLRRPVAHEGVSRLRIIV